MAGLHFEKMGGIWNMGLANKVPCHIRKCGEYNMLKCTGKDGHDGECCFVVDHENDYPHNREIYKEGQRGIQQQRRKRSV
jgi:hypothetical protein